MEPEHVHHELRKAIAAGGGRDGVLDALRQGRLLVALGRPDATQARDTPGVEPGALHFLAMPRDDGEPTLLCFSGGDTQRRWGFSDDYALARLPELWALVLERGLRSATVDSAGPVAITLDHVELVALAHGGDPEDVPPLARLVLRAPGRDVGARSRALGAALEPHACVAGAWVLEDEDGEPAAAVSLAPGAPAPAQDAALEAAAALLPVVVVSDWEAAMIRAEAVPAAVDRREVPAGGDGPA